MLVLNNLIDKKKAPQGRRSALEGHVCYLDLRIRVVYLLFFVSWYVLVDDVAQ